MVCFVWRFHFVLVCANLIDQRHPFVNGGDDQDDDRDHVDDGDAGDGDG